MKVVFHIVFMLVMVHTVQGQRLFKKAALTVQYAGSVGFLSVGYFKQTANDKFGIGLVYGNTPKSMGGPLGSLSLKLRYNPFQVKLYKNIYLEPLQAGIFLTQNFGKNLDLKWSSNYSKGYYWWGSSFRQHIFVSSQISILKEQGCFNKISFYWEANTNDLYLYSYFPNCDVLSLYDIIYFGIGVKFYIREH